METLERIKSSILRQELSSRGGGIEIDLTPFGYEGERMAAYQNYLGGGMLGSVRLNDTIRRQTLIVNDPVINKDLDEIGEELKKYFHSLTNPDGEWESRSYEENQQMPEAAY